MVKNNSLVVVLVVVVLLAGICQAEDPDSTGSETIQSLMEKANKEYMAAQFFLRVRYVNGQGVIQDYTEAVKWYRKAAEQNSTEAQLYLGYIYANGEGVTQDYAEAVKWCRRAAEQGYASAQFNLGVMYNNGDGVTQDDAEAVKWYRLAAEQGYASAQFNLGNMYSKGEGVIQDYKEAVKWYRLAAEQGDAAAQLNLGFKYCLGQGVIEDYVEAYKWLVLAGMTDEKARKSRDTLKQEMTAGQIAEGQQQAKLWLEEFEKRKNQPATGDNAMGTVKRSGAGFVISRDGYLLSSCHVVKGAAKIVVFIQGQSYPARVVLNDETLDVAVLKLEGSFTEILPLSAGRTKTGEQVLTLGYPNVTIQGTEPKYTEGVISALSGIDNSPRFYQISVAVQPGNSGGPLLDGRGQVVGVVTAKLDDINTLAATGSLPENVNYAIKSSFILPLLDSIEGLKLPADTAETIERSILIERAKKAVGLVLCY